MGSRVELGGRVRTQPIRLNELDFDGRGVPQAYGRGGTHLAMPVSILIRFSTPGNYALLLARRCPSLEEEITYRSGSPIAS